MNAKYIAMASTITGLIVMTLASARQMTDSPAVTMTPMKGISFELGAERAVSYFVSENEQCKVVLTQAGEPNWADPATFMATRFEATIEAGKTSSYVASNGRSIDFQCQPHASSVSIHGLEPALADAR